MTKSSEDVVPPGSYTTKTLPPLSKGAKRIYDKVVAKAKITATKKEEKSSSARSTSTRGLRLADKGGVGLRIK